MVNNRDCHTCEHVLHGWTQGHMGDLNAILKMSFSILFYWLVSSVNALWWTARDLTDDKSRLVQVKAWCRQATSHYLSQCWLSNFSPYDVPRPKFVKLLSGSVFGSGDTLAEIPNGIYVRGIIRSSLCICTVLAMYDINHIMLEIVIVRFETISVWYDRMIIV